RGVNGNGALEIFFGVLVVIGDHDFILHPGGWVVKRFSGNFDTRARDHAMLQQNQPATDRRAGVLP
ncbi:MAG: hypothetical protein ACOC3F_03375, partial [Desulfosudaceae bacterium]